jgi:uncharacterized coiled-coil protein SlyX
MAVQNARISTKDLDARLLAVEEKLSAIVEQLSRLERAAQEHAAPEHPEHPERPGQVITLNGGTDASDGSRLAQLESQVSRIDERIEKIASTLVEQASRLS